MARMFAIKFYKLIEKDSSKYRLVNGLFIVKYLDEFISIYIGDFSKKNSADNPRKNNVVWINDTNPNPQRFYKNGSKLMCTTGTGSWRKLGIAFKETPIEEILK